LGRPTQLPGRIIPIVFAFDDHIGGIAGAIEP
jgi:hypothetical protein